MTDQIAISVQNLNKTFIIPKEKRHTVKDHLFNAFRPNPKTKLKILDDINFEIKKGEFFGVIGRNGSGKSSLLKILSQIYQPDSGSTIKINGKISPFLELGVGFNPELTARENIYLNGAILGLSKKKIDKIFDSIIEFAELEGFVDQHLKYYSSGMQLRLAFSVAIQSDTDIIILDEVLAVGDANFQQKCFDIFREFKQKGKTIVFVSHDLSAVRQFCNRVLYLKDSKQVAIGDPNDIVDLYYYTDRSVKNLPESDSSNSTIFKITDVELIDKFNHINKTFVSGDPLLMKVKYKAIPSKIKNASIELSIYNSDDLIFSTNTFSKRLNLSLKPDGEVDILIKSLNLIEGAFTISLVIFGDNNQVVYEWKDKTYEFHVQKSSSDKGLVPFEIQFKT